MLEGIVCPNSHKARLHTAVGRIAVCEFESQLSFITFMVIDREIISMGIFPFQLNQEGYLSFTGKSICTKNWLTT